MDQTEAWRILDYDMDTGEFTWRVSTGRAKKGTRAGTVLNVGKWHYIIITYDSCRYMAHDLAWLWMTGKWPVYRIDHRNGIGLDNWWDNLREATAAENSQNLGISSRNKSGYMGVSWMATRNKWRAEICVNGKRIHLGLFTTPEAAYDAYLAAKAQVHPFQPKPRE